MSDTIDFSVPDVMLQDLAVNDIVEAVADREESILRAAILGTDWGETSVVRIIGRPPGPQTYDKDNPFEISAPSYRVERYADKAPPLSTHADGQRMIDVRTITWPLLETLAAEHDEIAEIVDVALGPDEA